MNKKALVLLSTLILAGCGGNTNSTSSNTNTAGNSTPSSGAPIETKETYSIGLGYTTSFKATQAEVTLAVAAFDEAGKILNARLDVVQVPLTIADGIAAIDTSSNEGLLSKLELGTGYGMEGASGIGKEVYLQIEAFADWTIGKTVEEVIAGTPGAGHGVAVNEELASSVTIGVDAFDAALTDAYETRFTATEGTAANAGIGMFVEMYGENELTVYTAGTITDENGVVEAAAIDNVVFPLTVTEGAVALQAGKYVGENNTIISKKKLGEDYKMDDFSGEACTAGDWYKQAAAIETFLLGKDSADLEAITYTDGKAEIAGATIKVESIMKSAEEAVEYSTKEVITANPQA